MTADLLQIGTFATFARADTKAGSPPQRTTPLTATTPAMPIDPATILHVLPKPGRREAVLLRRVSSGGVARLEITVASRLPSGTYHAVRGIGIGPDLLKAFAEAAPAAVDAVLASKGV